MKTLSRLAAFTALLACAGPTPPVHAEPPAPLSAASFAQIATATDALFAGKTPSPATQNFFKAYDNTAHTYRRNPECVAAGVDLSCMSISNSANADGSGGLRGCVTLVTPLHGVTNQHFGQPYALGVVHYFVDRANKVYPRKVVRAEQVEGTDIEVVTFDAPLPASVPPAPLLPASALARLLPPGTPLLATNQLKTLVVTELAGMSGGEIIVRPATAPARRAWTASPPAVLGDSDSPTFVVIDRRPYLLFTYHTSGSGPALSENISGIRSLIGSKYPLDVAAVR